MAKKIPITRNRFYDQKEFELDQSFIREFIESDVNQTVVLFPVNPSLSDTDEYYGNTPKSQLRHDEPVELKVYGLIEKAELISYSKNMGNILDQKAGNFTFEIYVQQLEELQTDIFIGDYIGYSIDESNMIYFQVLNDGRQNTDNKHFIQGYKPASRTITCTSVLPGSVNFI